MKCSEFLACYSEFHDGALSPEASRCCRGHIESCAACRRYDKVLTRGVDLLRTLSTTGPGDDFRSRLQHSIYTIHEKRRRRQVPRGSAAAMSAVAMVTIAASIIVTPVLWDSEPVVDLPPIIAQAPPPAPEQAPAPRPSRVISLSSPIGALPRPTALLPSPAIRVPRAFPIATRAGALPSTTAEGPRGLEGLDLWRESNELLYQHSSLYLRYRQPGLVRTGLR